MDLKVVNDKIAERPQDLELHELRYRLLLEHDDPVAFESALHDSALKLGHHFFIDKLAEALEGRGAFSTASYWRKELVRMKSTPERVAQLERCELNEIVAIAQAKITFVLNYDSTMRAKDRLRPEIDSLEQAILDRKVSGVAKALDLLDFKFEELLKLDK